MDAATSTSCTPGNWATAVQRAGGGLNANNGAERGTVGLAHLLRAHLVELVHGRNGQIRKQGDIQPGVGRERVALNGGFQQAGIQFVIRFVGQNGLDLGIGLENARVGVREADEKRIVGNVGNDGGTGGGEFGAKVVVHDAAGLDDVAAVVRGGAQGIGDGELEGFGGVNQGVGQEDGAVIAGKLADGLLRVAEPVGKTILQVWI